MSRGSDPEHSMMTALRIEKIQTTKADGKVYIKYVSKDPTGGVKYVLPSKYWTPQIGRKCPCQLIKLV